MLLSNVRFAIRGMLAQPSTTVAAVVALALGIGSTAAIFSILNTVLLRPLPYANPDRLVVAFSANPSRKIPFLRVSAPTYLDYKRLNHSLRIGSMLSGAMVLTGQDLPENLVSSAISPDLLDILGVTPRLGRNFAADADTPGKDHVVLLSDGLWKAKFGADENIAGKPVKLDSQVYLVAGVMPPGFRLLDKSA